MRSATSRWNISTSRSYQGGHGSSVSQPDQQSGGDVVGQVCDDARRRVAESGARIEVESIAGDDLEAARIPRGDLFERGDGAVVALDRDHPTRAGGEKRAREPARPGTDLDHVHALERTGRARDAGGEVEIEKKILPERLLGSQTVPADHLAQRRKVIDGAHQGGYARLRGLRSRSVIGCDCARAESLAAS